MSHEVRLPATSILLVDPDPASADAIADVLRPLGHELTVAVNYRSARKRLEGHQLIVISGADGSTRALELCRDVRADAATSKVPILAIVKPEAAEERVRWFDAGADDVLMRPFDPRELEARVDALLLRYQVSQELTSPEPAPKRRRIISFAGAKGGTGTTTAAVNVARAMIEIRPISLALVDLDLQRGQVATHLNLTPAHSLVDLAEDAEAIGNAELLDQYVARHSSGLAVVAAPAAPQPDASLTPQTLERILTALAQRHDAVIVDVGSRLDDRTLMAIEQSDEVVFVLAPDIASLRAMKAFVQALGHTGASVARTTFVLNHLYARELLRRSEVESAVGARIGFELPYDATLYQNAVNQGVPVVRGAPDSGPADAFRKLGALLLRSGEEEEAQAPDRRRRIAGVLRR